MTLRQRMSRLEAVRRETEGSIPAWRVERMKQPRVTITAEQLQAAYEKYCPRLLEDPAALAEAFRGYLPDARR